VPLRPAARAERESRDCILPKAAADGQHRSGAPGRRDGPRANSGDIMVAAPRRFQPSWLAPSATLMPRASPNAGQAVDRWQRDATPFLKPTSRPPCRLHLTRMRNMRRDSSSSGTRVLESRASQLLNATWMKSLSSQEAPEGRCHQDRLRRFCPAAKVFDRSLDLFQFLKEMFGGRPFY